MRTLWFELVSDRRNAQRLISIKISKNNEIYDIINQGSNVARCPGSVMFWRNLSLPEAHNSSNSYKKVA